MSDQQPATPPGQVGCGLLLGIILLLPGLCSLLFAFAHISDLLDARTSGFLLPTIWAIGLLIGALGVALITFAARRAHRK